MTKKTILLTGGTGSLGRAIIKRAYQEKWPVKFKVISRGETAQAKLRKQYPEIQCFLGDVAKLEDVERAMHNVDICLHLAAYKQVPMAQVNCHATIANNVQGSINVAKAAVEAGVERVVGVSTDKAAAPVNYYGASKYLMEGIFREYNQYGNTKFTLARYGNVICSNASVIPLFLRQAQEGGPLTVTDPDMTRFWITLEDAINIILKALTVPAGYIVVPKAAAMRMFDLAAAIADGLPIRVIGTRPGEKKHECMVTATESLHTIQDNDYFYIQAPDEYISDRPMFAYTSDQPFRVLTSVDILHMIKLSEDMV